MKSSNQIILPPYFETDQIKSLAKKLPIPVEKVLLFYSYLMLRNLSKAKRNEVSYKESRVSYAFQIHSEFIKLMLSRDKYTKVIQILKEQNLLKVDPSYSTGNKEGIIKKPGFTKKYQIPEYLLDHRYTKSKIHYTLTTRKAITTKEKMMAAIIKYKKSTIRLSPIAKKVLLNSLENIETQALTSLGRFQKTSGPSMDRYGNRFHSCLTNLKKGLRSEVNFKGSKEPLVEFDIKTSQMYFFINLSHEWLDAVLPSYDAIKLYTLVDELQKSHSYQQFKNIILDRDQDVYERYGKSLGIIRDDAKTIIFKLFFGSEHIKMEKETQHFEKLFPGLLKEVNKFKTVRLEDNHKKMYSNLALILQRMESKMVLDYIIEDAAEQGITQILTIHDSWFVKQSDAVLFAPITEQGFFYQMGNIPKINQIIYTKKEPSSN
ncbi:MAG: hypothetical protein R8N23_03605 [Reichenbachiella sp.]|uniref:hypothetical protein n=1 Tax=Reichenbachiella sp. TaxID=2184521 RepID=UPI0029660216|nr:hypothetical protein [Reichenbachiella sp.]MDW3208924.1 hypothetical protein [Reichenbachiella sp.]